MTPPHAKDLPADSKRTRAANRRRSIRSGATAVAVPAESRCIPNSKGRAPALEHRIYIAWAGLAQTRHSTRGGLRDRSVALSYVLPIAADDARHAPCDLRSRTAMLQVGQTVDGLLLRRKVADGGMGSVWAARDVLEGRDVAVKFLSPNRSEPEAATRFEREGRLMGRIVSPHVPHLFGTGACEDGTPFLVMELLDGKDVGSWLSRKGKLSVSEVARILEHVGTALMAAHAQGIVHRDVKPENIILCGDPPEFQVKLIDFGIATTMDRSHTSPSLTATGMTVGSAGYMSPEQLLTGDDIDERSDAWSLAVVAYKCLTGRLPFEGDTFRATFAAIQGGHFTPVTELVPELSPAVDGWFDKALSRDVDDRFPSLSMMVKMFRVATPSDSAWGDHAAALSSTDPQAQSEAEADEERAWESAASGQAEAFDTELAPEAATDAPIHVTTHPLVGIRVRAHRSRLALYALMGASLGILVCSYVLRAPTRENDAARSDGYGPQAGASTTPRPASTLPRPTDRESEAVRRTIKATASTAPWLSVSAASSSNVTPQALLPAAVVAPRSTRPIPRVAPVATTPAITTGVATAPSSKARVPAPALPALAPNVTSPERTTEPAHVDRGTAQGETTRVTPVVSDAADAGFGEPWTPKDDLGEP